MDNSPRFYNLEKVNSLFKYFFFYTLICSFLSIAIQPNNSVSNGWIAYYMKLRCCNFII